MHSGIIKKTINVTNHRERLTGGRTNKSGSKTGIFETFYETELVDRCYHGGSKRRYNGINSEQSSDLNVKEGFLFAAHEGNF